MITKADTPCPQCGCQQVMHRLDFSNPEAEEIPMIPVCVQCRKDRTDMEAR